MPKFELDAPWALSSNKQHMLESRCHFQCASRVQEQQQRGEEEEGNSQGTTMSTQQDGAGNDDDKDTVLVDATRRKAGAEEGQQGSAIKRGKRVDLLTRLVQQPAPGQGCDFCHFEGAVPFPLPEEVYSRNHVTLSAGPACQLRFCAMDALQQVREVTDHAQLTQVSYAKEWRKSRQDKEDELRPIKPYDWTYSTLYAGTLVGDWQVEESEEGIDFELLSQQEPILFQDHVFLLADDYSDNGLMHMDVRVRAMASCVYILQRQFVRVDNVLVHLHDTRVFRRAGSPHVIRECSTHEVDIPALDRAAGKLPDGRPVHVLCTPTDVNKVLKHFKRTRFQRTKLTPAAH